MIKYFKKEKKGKLDTLCYFLIKDNNWYLQQGWGFTDKAPDYNPTYMVEIDLNEFKDLIIDNKIDLSFRGENEPKSA